MLRRAKSVENINNDEKAIEDRKKQVKAAQKNSQNPADEHLKQEKKSTVAIVSGMYRYAHGEYIVNKDVINDDNILDSKKS